MAERYKGGPRPSRRLTHKLPLSRSTQYPRHPPVDDMDVLNDSCYEISLFGLHSGNHLVTGLPQDASVTGRQMQNLLIRMRLIKVIRHTAMQSAPGSAGASPP